MVSVLMCTYNRRFCLQQAIDSVLCQTYPDFEFVIVDDGSTDGTEELIKSYQDPRIRYFKLDQNSFYCYAANQGLDHCQGDYVAFMNSDDAWLPDKLEKQVSVMEQNRMLGACFTRVYLVDESGNEISEECRDMAALLTESVRHRTNICIRFCNLGIFFVILRRWSENPFWTRLDISIFCIVSWRIMTCGFGL